MERLDREWARGDVLARKEMLALERMREFAAAGPCYVGVSWGKDSVVVAHLAYRLWVEHGIRLPMVEVARPPTDNPDCDRVAEEFLLRFPTDFRRVVVPCEWDPATQKWWCIGDRSDRPKQVGFRRAAESVGTERYISGVRAEESGVRKASLRTHGQVTRNTCRPIGWWSGEDVFAYLVKHDLPVHPAYAMTLGGRLDRNRLRVGSLTGSHGERFGRREWERAYYADALDAIEAAKKGVMAELRDRETGTRSA